MATSASFGDANAGFQAGYINGPVNNPTFHHHAAPEPSETPPIPDIIIPFPQDRDFVRRDTICDQVILVGADPGSWVALVGLGGVGKSQIAIEHAYQTRDKSPETWVFWVHASNAARYEQSFRELADQVKLPGRQNAQNIFQLVSSWLRSDKSGKWLIILDNLDDASFLLEAQTGRQDAQGSTSSGPEDNRPLLSYLPRCQKGSVLVTTRRQDIALRLVEPHSIVAVGSMNQDDAVTLIEKKLGALEDDEDVETAGALAQALEYIPLAIVQATSYIAQRGLRYSMQKYLKKLKRSDSQKTSLLDVEGGHLRRDWEAKNSIILTWQISFDYIRESRPSAADLLSFMSWCDRQGIPESLLQEMIRTTNASQDDDNHPGDLYKHDERQGNDESANNSANDDSESDSSASDVLEEDILMLRNYSFIHLVGDGTSLEMHALVQLSMRKWLDAKGQQERWKQTFIKCLSSQIPNGEYENWRECQLYLPHAKAAAGQRPKDKESLLEWATIMYRAGWYLEQMGLGQEAQKMAEGSMEVRNDLLEREDEERLWAVSLVGDVYTLLGWWEEAEKLEVEVMEIRKATLGPDHPDTLKSIANLATTYNDQGRYDEAEKLEVEIMEISKATLGPDHPDTLNSKANLATTYNMQGRYGEAEKLRVDVMEIEKATLGPDHPNTLKSIANLAATYNMQGRYDEAEKLRAEAMEISKVRLGPDHPDTLKNIRSLASTYRNQRRLEEAEKLEVEVMEIRKVRLGPDHPDTLNSIRSLASIYTDRGRYKEAEKLEVEVMEISKVRLGPDHPDTLRSISNLAMTIWNQGRLEEAEKLEVEAMEISKVRLGPDHPDTLIIMHNLAYTWHDLGHQIKAIVLMRQSLELMTLKLGRSHPETLSSARVLARWETDLGERDYDEADLGIAGLYIH